MIEYTKLIRLIFNFKRKLDVKLQVEYMSYSAHADAKGIMQLISNCEPENVVLVHGEGGKMDFLRNQIIKEFSNAISKFLPNV